MEDSAKATSLYLVPTPIGNIKDITYRAVEVLKSVNCILAEDTRTSTKLLKHYDINTKLQSYHMHNEHKIVDSLIEKMQSSITYALITDAGTPGISDPGFLLVREAIKNNIKVESLPGATAFVPALVKSGFPTDKFVFEGFLPHKKGRQTRLKLLAEESRSVVFYESPHRLLKTLHNFAEFFGEDREISVSRELTKLYEETLTDTVSNLIQHFDQKAPRGEIVIIVKGMNKKQTK